MTGEEGQGGESGAEGQPPVECQRPTPGRGTGKPPGGWKPGDGANCRDVMLFRTSASSKIISFGCFFWMRTLIEVPRTY